MTVVVLRAHNEEETLATVISHVRKEGFEPVVAASGSTDGTVEVALAAGVAVQQVPIGLGAATVTILRTYSQHAVILLDADLQDIPVGIVAQLASIAEEGRVGKGVSDTAGRSSRLLPALAAHAGVTLPDVPPQALTSAYAAYPAGFASVVPLDLVPADRGSDLMVSLLAMHAGYVTEVVPTGPRSHRHGDDSHIARLVAANTLTFTKYAEWAAS